MSVEPTYGNKIFIVHGSDNVSKNKLKRFLEKNWQLKPIILHEQASQGRTIIEKLENYSDVGYVFVLLTPDDIGGRTKKKLFKRARQNVVFEFGLFVGRRGRNRVCCLYKSSLETPSDLDGLVHISFTKSVTECFLQISKELTAAGYTNPKDLTQRQSVAPTSISPNPTHNGVEAVKEWLDEFERNYTILTEAEKSNKAPTTFAQALERVERDIHLLRGYD